MATVRYYLALFLVMSMPGVFLLWVSIHPFVSFWRRLGPTLTYTVNFSLIAIVAVGIFMARRSLLAIEFGTSPLLIGLAIPIYVLAGVLLVQLRRQLKASVLIGLPELDPTRYPGRLVTKGIYSRMRHPRYVELLLAVLAYALVANYLAAYIAWLLSLLVILVVVRFEEKELRDRFHEDYEEYCRKVPRFLPRLKG